MWRDRCVAREGGCRPAVDPPSDLRSSRPTSRGHHGAAGVVAAHRPAARGHVGGGLLPDWLWRRGRAAGNLPAAPRRRGARAGEGCRACRAGRRADDLCRSQAAAARRSGGGPGPAPPSRGQPGAPPDLRRGPVAGGGGGAMPGGAGTGAGVDAPPGAARAAVLRARAPRRRCRARGPWPPFSAPAAVASAAW